MSDVQQFSLDYVDGTAGELSVAADQFGVGIEPGNFYNNYFARYGFAFGDLTFVSVPPFPGGPFGFNSPDAGAAPEPSTLGLLALGSMDHEQAFSAS